MGKIFIKYFKFKCKHCGEFFVRRAFRGMEFVFICEHCGQRDNYKIPLKDASGGSKMYSPEEQFALFPELIGMNK